MALGAILGVINSGDIVAVVVAVTGVEVSLERFKSMLDKKGITAYALARQIDSTTYQMWRLKSGRHTTGFHFLQRLVPVFGLSDVVDAIADEDQAEAFMWWYIATTKKPSRKTA